MRPANLLQPHYLFRPSQILRRLRRSWRPVADVEDVALPWGVDLQVDTRETIGHWVLWTGVWDVAVCETLWRLLRPGDVAVDAGANIGTMSTLMAVRVGPTGRVLSVEPSPAILPRLELNIARVRARPGTAPVEILPMALSSKSGTATLAADEHDFALNQGVARIVDAAAPSSSAVAFQVRTTRLDDVMRGQAIRVLKADVEGHEAELFRGASELLGAGAITHIVYEDQAGGASPVHDLLTAHGYTIFALGRRLLGPVLGDRHARLTHPGETPDFVATRAPDELRRAMAPRGWRVLRAGS